MLIVHILVKERVASAITETVTLTYEERCRHRQRLVTDQGREVHLALPRATVLRHGDALISVPELTVEVVAAPESVIDIKASDWLTSARVAHQLGNWHRPVQILSEGILRTLRDAPLHDWLSRSGIRFEEAERPFHPNLLGAGHHP
ncbi:urease accessory protein UreE [Leptolyngbya sp. FACHB-261]|uniref:urease accessory protein UreE n=1 Tax=Leptolyngbya sp. FACHB-261 TaxID=2692806 RepID=UPI0016853201|nr:urease accessory protein UreE [Leptolyngbya sp. FACHB-261]MBD2104163.1 urease accessory protein UreE [Leptolyngbya sp. FACHB-261]